MEKATITVECTYCRHRFQIKTGIPMLAPRHKREVDAPGVECPGSKQYALWVQPVAPRGEPTGGRMIERLMKQGGGTEGEIP